MAVDQPVQMIRQVGQHVTLFSSQYGTGRSYSASNLAGPGYGYPSYGDFVQAFVLRTYGPWWQLAPSSTSKLKRKTKAPCNFISQDFVDVAFECPVYSKVIHILETYNPGAVVRILALKSQDEKTMGIKSDGKSWVTLWSGAPQTPPAVARSFSPKLRQIDKPLSLIRLEFNQDHLDYYTELDAVELMGNAISGDSAQTVVTNESDRSGDLETVNTMRLFRQLSITDKSQDEGKKGFHNAGDNGFFDILPSEVINLIFSCLELTDLIRAACTCKLFFVHCYDPVWFKELDLQPYWHMISDTALEGLQTRCVDTDRLSLSWAGPYGAITSAGFQKFLNASCRQLVCLRLSTCTFVDGAGLYTLTRACPSLEELDLSSCTSVNDDGFTELQLLTKLKKLNLYRTTITDDILNAIIRSCPLLEHLNIGGCTSIARCDEVTLTLATHCRGLISLDLWRVKSLSSDGVFSLAGGCSQLEELDVGWCTSVVSSSGCIQEITRGCPRLKKLFLPAIRSVSDDDVAAIADNCSDLEQLDILGTSLVTPATVRRVLLKCPKLIFVDLSFCTKLTKAFIEELRVASPKVAFKKSFVTDQQDTS